VHVQRFIISTTVKGFALLCKRKPIAESLITMLIISFLKFGLMSVLHVSPLKTFPNSAFDFMQGARLINQTLTLLYLLANFILWRSVMIFFLEKNKYYKNANNKVWAGCKIIIKAFWLNGVYMIFSFLGPLAFGLLAAGIVIYGFKLLFIPQSTLLALCLGMAPALYFCMKWGVHYAFAAYYTLLKSENFNEAIEHSAELVKGHFWQTTAVLAIPCSLYVIILSLCQVKSCNASFLYCLFLFVMCLQMGMKYVYMQENKKLLSKKIIV